ncbi:ATP-binding protein [Demequina sp. SYSU T00192]|uniref:ATP-binding protein n=1 Tax=Demequina litoralis TaxID=3051660 RepID=A0ABT8G9G6_9MICO|nr:ATP-binding protein [Demequina sp. SYSU T00192]MDN4475324.1 ATP-binding protein [Demequina sp. SYSU T00192]
MPSNAATAALDLPVVRRAAKLLELGEDQWFDRKSVRIKPAKLAESIAAFAHAEGGSIVIGLSDGIVERLDRETSRINDLRQASIDFLRPPAPVQIREVACRRGDGLDAHLLVILVEPSEQVHETVSGDCYLRVGDENRRLTFAQRQELEFDRGLAKYEAQKLQDRSFRDLSPALVESYRRAAGASGSPERFLATRGLLTSALDVTVGAYLLFAEHPQDLFPSAFVRVLRYFGTDRGSGSRQALDSETDLRIEGPIPRVIAEATQVIERNIPRRRALGADGKFSAIPIVPRAAWLEGLVNAVVHRSYSMGGDHIRVELFEDRVVITSPGRFPGLANLTDPLEAVRYARNPRIARVCFDLSITQELGEGIRRIFEEMRERGLSDPLYEQGSGHVRLTLLSQARVNDQVLASLPTQARALFKMLEGVDRPMRTGDVVDLAGMSRPTVLKYLRILEDAGLVEWRGQSPNDRTATWGLLG